MKLYPAIDIRGGRAVRLLRGDPSAQTDYGDPVAAALEWKRQGAADLHVVDLDGAFTGDGMNLGALASIVTKTGLPVQTGGGIRSMADIEERLERVGVHRVILGTAAVENPALVRDACRAYPGRIAVGIDARDGKVAIRGWKDESALDAIRFALEMRDAGVDDVIFTDIGADGTLEGPNVAQTKRLIDKTGMRVIGSGGVSCIEDLLALREAGCAGAILGKALYAGRFTLLEAIEALAAVAR